MPTFIITYMPVFRLSFGLVFLFGWLGIVPAEAQFLNDDFEGNCILR